VSPNQSKGEIQSKTQSKSRYQHRPKITEDRAAELFGDVWKNALQRTPDPLTLGTSLARGVYRRALHRRWSKSTAPLSELAVVAVGRTDHFTFADIAKHPNNYIRHNALPYGLLPIRPEDHTARALRIILNHLRSLESEETYEEGPIYIPTGEEKPLDYGIKKGSRNIEWFSLSTMYDSS